MPNKINNSLFNLYLNLWNFIPSNRKYQVYTLIVVVIFAAIFEIISVGMLLPFLGFISEPEKVINFLKTYNIVIFENKENMFFQITLIFIAAAIISGFLRVLVIRLNTQVSFSIGSDISLLVFDKVLHQPYGDFLNCNSSEIIDVITNKINSLIYCNIQPILTIVSSLVFFGIIFSTLIYINPGITFLVLIFFLIIYSIILFATKKTIEFNGRVIATKSNDIIRIIQESLGGIRDIIIDSSQRVFTNEYLLSDKKLRNSQGNNLFIVQSPRYIIESLGIVIIAISAYYSTVNLPNTPIVAILGIVALGAQRLLPILQHSYAAYIDINAGAASMESVLDLLSIPDRVSSEFDLINFKNKIELKNVTFKYDNKNDSIRNINLVINRGDKVGIIGESGSGKSTLVDIIMGLLKPTQGELLIDNVILSEKNTREWQRKISHVPQMIFLSGGTIKSNIAFGIEDNEIDFIKLRHVSNLALLSSVIEDLPDKYETIIGEKGIKLSGGQRQRLAIARAFYKNSEILVLDEATSALDNNTEEKIMDAIKQNNSDITILMIAHRLTTLKWCDSIIKIKNGEIDKIYNSYDELMNDK